MNKEPDKYFYTNISDYVIGDSAKAGELYLRKIISGFSCPLNPDVEDFLKDNAIGFTKEHKSVTYLVGSNEHNVIVGYFTITIKPINVIVDSSTNSKIKRKCEKISVLDENTNTYRPAAYLIGQLGKNYTNKYNELITGQELLDLALKIIKKTQYYVGGLLVFLEAKNEDKLLSFYAKNGFKIFNVSETKISQKHGYELVQMIKTL